MATLFQLDPQLDMIYEQLNNELKQSDDSIPSSDDDGESNDTLASQYCIPSCAHGRQQGNSAMVQCCCCMQWFHPSCCNEDKKQCKGVWTCLECRKTSQRVINLEKKVDLLANLNMKLIILLHDKHTKFLEPNASRTTASPSNHHNRPPSATKSKMIVGTQTKVMDRVMAEQKEVPVLPEPNIANFESKKPKIVVVCDSMAKSIKPTDLITNNIQSCEIKHVAAKINQVTDYVQDNADVSNFLLVHSGTNNVSKESYATVNQRLERLETNIKHKGLTNVGLSSIVYRNNQFIDSKIKMVNNHIRSICAKNNWAFIDNDNVDESCLCGDNLHLNKHGMDRLTVNYRLAVENFTKNGNMKIP